jgi:hypothetical protein
MVPGPSTSTVSPKPTSPTSSALSPTLSGSSSAARTGSVPGRRRTQPIAGARTKRAKAPSRVRPKVRLNLQRSGWPPAQSVHCMQPVVGIGATGSPSDQPETPGPTAAMRPQNSCPSVTGSRLRMKS